MANATDVAVVRHLSQLIFAVLTLFLRAPFVQHVKQLFRAINMHRMSLMRRSAPGVSALFPRARFGATTKNRVSMMTRNGKIFSPPFTSTGNAASTHNHSQTDTHIHILRNTHRLITCSSHRSQSKDYGMRVCCFTMQSAFRSFRFRISSWRV